MLKTIYFAKLITKTIPVLSEVDLLDILFTLLIYGLGIHGFECPLVETRGQHKTTLEMP